MYINFQVEYTNYTCVYRYPVMLKLLQLHIYTTEYQWNKTHHYNITQVLSK